MLLKCSTHPACEISQFQRPRALTEPLGIEPQEVLSGEEIDSIPTPTPTGIPTMTPAELISFLSRWFKPVVYGAFRPGYQAEPTQTPPLTGTPSPTVPSTLEPSPSSTHTQAPTKAGVDAQAQTEISALLTSGSLTIDYVYDPLNRLTGASYSTGDSYHYSYDAVGNRKTQERLIGGSLTNTTYDYDDANRLQFVNGVEYIWDDNGNLLSDGLNTYTYDAANRLKALTGPSVTANIVIPRIFTCVVNEREVSPPHT